MLAVPHPAQIIVLGPTASVIILIKISWPGQRSHIVVPIRRTNFIINPNMTNGPKLHVDEQGSDDGQFETLYEIPV